MASSSKATTSSEGPRYQGYPYVNLPAFGVPTIDSHTASRYANLPRRPVGTAVRVEDAESSGGQSSQDNAKTPDSDDEPVLYIDLPAEGESDLYLNGVNSASQDTRIPPQSTQTSKGEDEHVVYIDLPECSGSGVSDRRPEDGPSTTVVQETIFYDQFKNRRIDVIPQTLRADSGLSARRVSSSYSPMSPPQRPTTLSLWSHGSADASSSVPARPAPNVPSYLSSTQTLDNRYRSSPGEEFNLPPLPVTEFPDPPPAYTEIDFGNPERPIGNVQNVSAETSLPQDTPQRTRVILHQPSCNSNRKVMTCDRCQMSVNSLVVRQVTLETHLVALICFAFALIPCLLLVYCCDFCKCNVHYCPICNSKIKKEFRLCSY